jgi:hypothetical protein
VASGRLMSAAVRRASRCLQPAGGQGEIRPRAAGAKQPAKRNVNDHPV